MSISLASPINETAIPKSSARLIRFLHGILAACSSMASHIFSVTGISSHAETELISSARGRFTAMVLSAVFMSLHDPPAEISPQPRCPRSGALSTIKESPLGPPDGPPRESEK